jgi:hypothetical protein
VVTEDSSGGDDATTSRDATITEGDSASNVDDAAPGAEAAADAMSDGATWTGDATGVDGNIADASGILDAAGDGGEGPDAASCGFVPMCPDSGLVRSSWPGDVNGDGCVDGRDVAGLVACLGKSVVRCSFAFLADLNGDGRVDTKDYLLVVGHYGAGCDGGALDGGPPLLDAGALPDASASCGLAPSCPDGGLTRPAQPGDTNGDGCVDQADYDLLVGCYGKVVSDRCSLGVLVDFNGDGVVYFEDYLVLARNWGVGCADAAH